MKRLVGFLTLFVVTQFSFGQSKDTSIFRYPIQMDSVVITAIRNGWDVQAFIRRVQTDTSFYKAFHNLHLEPFVAKNKVEMYTNLHNQIKASLESETNQTLKNGCRTMATIKQKTTGSFFTKKGAYKYYTAALYAYLFLDKGPVCNESPFLPKTSNTYADSRLARNKQTLKELIFNPGKEITGIPFLGNSTAIFSQENLPCYDFKLEQTQLQGEECFLFKARAKLSCKSDLVYQQLDTWFRKSDYAILARNYSLRYKTLVYDFDVTLQVRLGNIGGLHVPIHVFYNGDWRIFSKGSEKGSFLFEVQPKE